MAYIKKGNARGKCNVCGCEVSIRRVVCEAHEDEYYREQKRVYRNEVLAKKGLTKRVFKIKEHVVTRVVECVCPKCGKKHLMSPPTTRYRYCQKHTPGRSLQYDTYDGYMGAI